jgi:hypothetical protein
LSSRWMQEAGKQDQTIGKRMSTAQKQKSSPQGKRWL